MRKIVLACLSVAAIMLLSNCANNTTVVEAEKQSPTADTATVSGVECDVTIAGLHFTKSVNDAASLIEIDKDGKVIFTAGEKSDYFSDPNGKLSNTTGPILLSHVDNTKPFTLTAKVTPGFAPEDLYNAGVLYIYVNDGFFQKFCFEQDERGKHRVVTVRTQGTSDDNNHDVVEQPYVYMKISSDTRTVASYYSLDNETWQMVRLYENNYPSEIWVGIASQCPQGKGNKSIFENITLETKSVSDFRLGI